MPLTLTRDERVALEAARARSRVVRHWQRYHAVLLRADGLSVAEVARALKCTRRASPTGRRPGGRGASLGWRRGCIRARPAASTRARRQHWTRCCAKAARRRTAMRRPVGRCRCCAASWRSAAGRPASGRAAARCIGSAGAGNAPSSSSATPIRRTQRKKPSLSRRARWWRRVGRCGSATRRPCASSRRCAPAGRGAHRVVVISGRNAQRAVHGALNVATGELVTLIRERSRQDDSAAFMEALGRIRPTVPKLLVWDNAPLHHPKRVLAAAATANLRIAFLPFRAPGSWRARSSGDWPRGLVAANRASLAVQEQAERAIAWFDALSPYERLLKTGQFGRKFQWLSTYRQFRNTDKMT